MCSSDTDVFVFLFVFPVFKKQSRVCIHLFVYLIQINVKKLDVCFNNVEGRLPENRVSRIYDWLTYTRTEIFYWNSLSFKEFTVEFRI